MDQNSALGPVRSRPSQAFRPIVVHRWTAVTHLFTQPWQSLCYCKFPPECLLHRGEFDLSATVRLLDRHIGLALSAFVECPGFGVLEEREADFGGDALNEGRRFAPVLTDGGLLSI